MLRVNVSGVVLHPGNAAGLGVAVVRNIVDMALKSPKRCLSFTVNAVLSASRTRCVSEGEAYH